MKNFCYHGIGTNLLRYESILKHGILTKKSAASCTAFNVNGSRCFNGNKNISVVIPHYDTTSGSIINYVFKGISFLITNEPYEHAYYTNSYSGIFDEGYIYHPIPTSNLSGIIVPTHLRNKKISELPVIGIASLDSISSITQSVINTLIKNGVDPESFTDTQDLIACYDTINNDTSLSCTLRNQAIEQIQNKLDTNLSQKLESYYQEQLGKQDITLMDVIDFYKPTHLPVYDENDVQEQCKNSIYNIPEYIRAAESHYYRTSYTTDPVEKTKQNKRDTNSSQKQNSYYQKYLRKADTTHMDVIDSYNSTHLPVYDEIDVQEQCKNIPEYIIAASYHYSTSYTTNPVEKPIDIGEDSFKKIARRQTSTSINIFKEAFIRFINLLHDKNINSR